MKPYNTQAKKLEFILSLGFIKDITNDSDYSNELGKPTKKHRYIFVSFDNNKTNFIDLTCDVNSIKDFINILFYNLQ